MNASPTGAGFKFEFGLAALEGNGAGLAVPVLAGAGNAGADGEETLFAGAQAVGERDGFALFEDGEWLVGVAVEAACPELGAQTEVIYRNLLGLARTHGRRIARIWNYVPAINAASSAAVDKGLENYRVFSRGRAAAFEAERVGVPPAASAVGGAPDRLAVIFAAARAEPRVIENPEQVPAYKYPPVHGPRAPSFSRAAQVEANGRRWTFVSGTAAIKGHATVAPECLAGQIDCTLDNLRLISTACGLGEGLGARRVGSAERHFKVYLRHAADLVAVRAELEARLLRPEDRVTWLRSDICRAALKLEIEATVVE